MGALVLLEHYEWDPPPDAYSLRNSSGGLIKLPAPDYVQLTHREYGHRVGVFRLLDTLERHGIPVTVAVDKLTAVHYPWLIDHLMQRGCELVGHGVAASQLITSKLSEDDEAEIITDCYSKKFGMFVWLECVTIEFNFKSFIDSCSLW